MKKFKLHADVLYVHVYDVEAETKEEAISMVQNEEASPLEVSPVTGPLVTHVKEDVR